MAQASIHPLGQPGDISALLATFPMCIWRWLTSRGLDPIREVEKEVKDSLSEKQYVNANIRGFW